MAIVPATEEGSGEKRNGAIPVGTGTDQRETAKQSRKNVASEIAVRKRMMEDTSNIIIFDWVREKGHEGCQTG